jgi:hypothetical protein
MGKAGSADREAGTGLAPGARALSRRCAELTRRGLYSSFILHREGEFMPRTILAGIVLLLLLADGAAVAESKTRVVIFGGVVTEVAVRPGDSKDLWVSSADLTKATRFELKPQGVCSEQQCYPIPAGREKEFLAESQGTTWFNLGEFARQLRLPAAHDLKHDVWYFGPRPEMQNGYVESLVAPDFQLADVDGKKHSLSDFRGKKVLLITWASW